SGSGWVQAIGALVAGIIAVGMIWPALATGRVEVSCVGAPADATSGAELTILVVANRHLRVSPLLPEGTPVLLSPRRPSPVALRPPFRGSITAVRVRLATAAPLGLLWWSVERDLILQRPVRVAPRAVPSATGVDAGEDRGLGSARAKIRPAGEIRQIRTYRYGDSRRHVHWGATAHARSLMVRETEEAPSAPKIILADLDGGVDDAEQRAGAALGAVKINLAAGRRVILVTSEDGRRLSKEVPDCLAAGRRLARAEPNPYADLDLLGRYCGSRPTAAQ
ncbi:MAG: DUF58 domain-containing protein, partial [Acidimicrobiales bacterium]